MHVTISLLHIQNNKLLQVIFDILSHIYQTLLIAPRIVFCLFVCFDPFVSDRLCLDTYLNVLRHISLALCALWPLIGGMSQVLSAFTECQPTTAGNFRRQL